MSDSRAFTNGDPLHVLQKETEEIELLLPPNSRPALSPIPGARNQEETLLPSKSRPVLPPTSGARNQTKETSRPPLPSTSGALNQTKETLLPSKSRPALPPTSGARNQTEETLPPPTSRPALSPTSGAWNQEETLLPSKSRPALPPTSGARNQIKETLLPSMSRPALSPTSGARNQTEETLLPSTSRLPNQSEQTAITKFKYKIQKRNFGARNQTEETLLPSTSRPALSPTRTRHLGVSPAASDEEAVSGADDEDLAEPSSIRIEDRELRDAIQAWDVASVKWLLATGAPLTHVADGTTPLHMCVEKYWIGEGEDYVRSEKYQIKKFEIIEAMSEAAKKSGVLDCPNGKGQTPLYVAIESGNFQAIRVLVCAGANVSNLNRIGETPLHVAVRSQHPKILKYFLDHHDIPNSFNKYGYAPMHFAAISGELEPVKLLLDKFYSDQLNLRKYNGETPWHCIAGWNSMAIAQYLFQTDYSWDLNVVDDTGQTPLFRAARQGNVPMTTLLLRNGAALSVKGETESAIKGISSEFNNPLNFFEDLFDECVNEKENVISVNYEVLVGSKDMSQIKVLEDFVRYGLSKILKHPTIESLIYFKWRCLLPVFYTIIVTYVTFLLSLNIFVITTFYNIDTGHVTCDTKEVQFNATEALFNASEMPFKATEALFNATEMPFNATDELFNATEVQFNATKTPCVEGCGWRHWTLVVFIYISTGVLITQECIWIYLQKLHHFRRPETWLKLGVLGLALAVPMFLGCSSAPDSMTWQRHLACVAVLLAWLQAMLLMSRFHGWGYYVLMLERVAINILKILATTIFLVFAFSTCLMIQYQSKPPFDGPGAAFTKTLVMMASEFDYEDLFGEDHDAELKNTKKFVRLLFVVFVVFIAIVLMNFMIGVAVSDVEELNDIGNIRRLEKQVQLLSTLEGLGDTVLAKWWRRLLLIRFHSSIGRSISSPVRLWAVDDLCDPTQHNDNDYFRERFSSELHNAILNILKKKKQNVDKLDAVYDAVIGMSHQKLDSVSIASSSPITTLDERMRSLEDKMDKILESIASNVNPQNRAKVVSHKLSRRRKLFKRKVIDEQKLSTQ